MTFIKFFRGETHPRSFVNELCFVTLAIVFWSLFVAGGITRLTEIGFLLAMTGIIVPLWTSFDSDEMPNEFSKKFMTWLMVLCLVEYIVFHSLITDYGVSLPYCGVAIILMVIETFNVFVLHHSHRFAPVKDVANVAKGKTREMVSVARARVGKSDINATEVPVVAKVQEQESGAYVNIQQRADKQFEKPVADVKKEESDIDVKDQEQQVARRILGKFALDQTHGKKNLDTIFRAARKVAELKDRTILAVLVDMENAGKLWSANYWPAFQGSLDKWFDEQIGPDEEQETEEQEGELAMA